MGVPSRRKRDNFMVFPQRVSKYHGSPGDLYFPYETFLRQFIPYSKKHLFLRQELLRNITLLYTYVDTIVLVYLVLLHKT